MGGERFRPGNAITLLRSGAEYFPALEEAIHNAQREVHLETYIFADDPTGRRIADALARAAARGVQARVIVDGFGSHDVGGNLLEDMRLRGVDVQVYRPEVAAFRFRRHRLRRLHRKIAVVDGAIAFVGGINVIDDINTPHQIPPRYDYAVKIEGPLLADIHPVVVRLWRQLRWSDFRRRGHTPRPPPPIVALAGERRAAFLVRDNLRHRRDIEDAYLEAIAAAREEIVIANAYFLPGQRFRHALSEATARGVRVVLLLQGRVEYFLLHYATRALYGSLLANGVEILEYRKSFLHAKVAVIDGLWATVGSSNLDPLSLLLAREANVLVEDPAFAGDLRTRLVRAIAEGRQMERAEFERRPRLQRVLEWVALIAMRLALAFQGKNYL